MRRRPKPIVVVRRPPSTRGFDPDGTIAEFDPNRDDAIGYAQRLLQARVPVDLHQWPGTFHGSQAILSAEVSQRQIGELGAVLRRALSE